MKQREELRKGKRVTAIEREPHELTPEERLAAQEDRIAALEAQVAEMKKIVGKPAQ